jgi:hypothetical protein
MTAAEIEALMQQNDGNVAMSEVMPLIIAFTVDKHGSTVILGTVDVSDMYSITRATSEAIKAKVCNPTSNLSTLWASVTHTRRG